MDPNSALAIVEGCDEEATVQKLANGMRYIKLVDDLMFGSLRFANAL